MLTKKLLTLLLLLNLYTSLYSQTDFRKGFIIKLSNDSVAGWIKYRGDAKNSLMCTFKNDAGLIEEFKPGEIKSYRFDQGKFYISKYVKTTGERAFAEYLVEGKKNLYFIRNKKGFHFFIDHSSDTITEISYNEKLITRNGVTYKKESTTHRTLLKSYFSECPAIFPEIESLRRPDFNNMVKLTKDYHYKACDSNCIVYYKKNKFRILVEPQIGMGNYDRLMIRLLGDTPTYTNSVLTGLMFYLWMPNSSEKLYFKTGFSYVKNNSGEAYSISKVPIQFEYIFLNRSIRPKVDLGVNYYVANSSNGKGKGLTLACSAGVLIKITKSIFYSVDVSSDLADFLGGNSFILSRSAETGLRISF